MGHDQLIWGDYFPSAAHDFAKDPLALDYQTPVPVVLPTLPNTSGTQHDVFFNKWNAATLRSVAFLEAVNASFDRYAAALQAGDNLSATVQLAAYLHYLRLFSEALADAKERFTQLPAVLTQLGIVGGGGNASTIQSMQTALTVSGFAPGFVDFLLSNGLSNADLPKYLLSLSSFSFRPGPDIYSSAAINSRLFTALFSKKVRIDIKPRSERNPIRLRSNGAISVAILSDTTFDATQVNPMAVIFAGAHAKLRVKKNEYVCKAGDVNGDGLLDLVCRIPIDQLNVHPSDTSAMLTAATFGGQAIAGIDSIKVIP